MFDRNHNSVCVSVCVCVYLHHYVCSNYDTKTHVNYTGSIIRGLTETEIVINSLAITETRPQLGTVLCVSVFLCVCVCVTLFHLLLWWLLQSQYTSCWHETEVCWCRRSAAEIYRKRNKTEGNTVFVYAAWILNWH